MNPWDKLSEYFDTHKDATEISPAVADNILNQPVHGYMSVSEDVRIPVFIRAEAEYDQIVVSLGVTRVYVEKPPFTSLFLEKHHSATDTNQPEFLAMAYQKP